MKKTSAALATLAIAGVVALIISEVHWRGYEAGYRRCRFEWDGYLRGGDSYERGIGDC